MKMAKAGSFDCLMQSDKLSCVWFGPFGKKMIMGDCIQRLTLQLLNSTEGENITGNIKESVLLSICLGERRKRVRDGAEQ